MTARTALIAAALSLFASEVLADDALATVRAAIAPGGESVRLTATSGGKAPGLTLRVGRGKASRLHAGEAIGTVKVGHGKAVIAFAVDTAAAPFRVHVVGGKTQKIERPGKRADIPFAVVMTPTPTGFTVLFQDIEAANANEAHTYAVELDEDGIVASEPREVAIPWALGDAIWNGNGYHLALFYAGDMNGVRLSMVSCDAKLTPQQHPDWASRAGLVSDVHLVGDGKRIRAFYRGGMGDRLLEADVTKIRNWGSEPPKAKDHGALAASHAIAINAKGTATKLRAK